MKILVEKARWKRSLLTELNLHTSRASLKQVQQQSVKRNLKRQIQRLLRSFAGPERIKQDPVALSLRSPTGRELNGKRIHRHSLQRSKLVRVWPSLHSIKFIEVICLDHSHLI